MPHTHVLEPGSELPLSIFLITRNEADRLDATLAAVQGLGREIVVVDSGSTDETAAIARTHGARVIHHDWVGYGPQKRFAEEQCTQTWLLNLDGDEVVPASLRQEIFNLFSVGPPRLDGYRIPIAEVFPGEDAPHPWSYAVAPVRLYRKDRGRYADSLVHDRVAMAHDAKIGRLKTRIHHHSVRSLGDQIAKLNRYTDLQARDLALRGKAIPGWRVFVEFPLAFFKAYILRRHAVRGLYGVLTAMNYAFSRHLRVAKHIEARRLQRRKPPAQDEGTAKVSPQSRQDL